MADRTTTRYSVRRNFFGENHREVGGLSRDVNDIVGKVPVVQHRKIESLYKEPMFMGGFNIEPFCIECVRIVELTAPTAIVTCSGMVHFTWLPLDGGAQINRIEGMSPGTSEDRLYRFYFRITFDPGALNG